MARTPLEVRGAVLGEMNPRSQSGHTRQRDGNPLLSSGLSAGAGDGRSPPPDPVERERGDLVPVARVPLVRALGVTPPDLLREAAPSPPAPVPEAVPGFFDAG